MNRFEQKIVLVTGASTGIGKATVKRIINEGGKVYAGIFDETNDIDQSGASPIRLDVTSEYEWQQAIDTIREKEHRLDILVNNAGIRESGSIEQTTLDQWQRVIDTNLTSIFLGCRAAIPLVGDSGGGAIVNLASITGIRGVQKMIAYSASKSGIISLTASLALESCTGQYTS